ncbi:CubicO group peptidase, beta-lactamase class C family [Altererythrobacter xiamenensis]|uniref:CubicO group peptidase, beta-lactamase class C family n=1 Tax=Altererythrobacter xiamenensis TaxID=1316679 RepID=A0A1Y6F3L6_9SPHN|nr:serine hydrolase [Altererythrobacter xiamenensis]SMQ69096.1 CubicO group peptidase, beta-lactamase class C family [Altererythrobacter xiamenensis]
MMKRSLAPIALLAALPSLTSCGEAEIGEPPLTEAALAAVTEEAGAPREDLARAVDELFTKEGLGETRALVVMANGEIAAERYGEGYDADTRFVSWSMAKTVTAVMIGMLVADGRLSIDESAPVELWQRPGDPRGEITLRQLLQMRSGLRHTEAGDPPYESSEVRMLFLDGRDDMARWAKEQPLEAEPGAQFEYSSNTTVILADIAARALTDSDDPEIRRRAVADFLEARLFGPLGMDSMVPEFDASGTLIGGSLIHGTARDWAKLGEFLRRKGRAPGGEQLVPRRWVELMVSPSPRSPQYGLQTWLNREYREAGDESEHPLFPDRAPGSVFSLIGHMGQYVIVSPEQRVTLVRLGHSDRPQRIAMLQELADILELYPER